MCELHFPTKDRIASYFASDPEIRDIDKAIVECVSSLFAGGVIKEADVNFEVYKTMRSMPALRLPDKEMRLMIFNVSNALISCARVGR